MRRWRLPVFIAVFVPAVIAGWTMAAVFAQESPSPSASASGLSGDPAKGAQVFSSAGCTQCHGAGLEGGVGPKLNPIQKLPGVDNPLDPSFLSETIRNGRGGDPGFSAQMPAFAADKVSDQELNDLIAFIINQNQSGEAGGQARTRTTGLEVSAPHPATTSGGSVLILFSDTGGGHRAAARALDGALRVLDPEVRVHWCDPLMGQGRAVARRLSSLYPTIIKRSPTTWGAIFHASNTGVTFTAIRAALRPQLGPVLRRQLERADPDVVLSVHPLLNHITASVLRRDPRRRALMTVVTDLVDVHRGWACRAADLVVVPTEAAERATLSRGVPADRVRLLGMPVDLRFRPAEPGEAAAVRRRLGLDEARRTVLVAGGGEGSGRLFDQVRALGEDRRPWQVIAVCGRNERLRRRMLRVRFETPTLVLGFVDDMPELLRASDLAVGKAGPGAIAEALATGLPLVLTGYLPGQERGNVRFVTESGVGLYAPGPDRLLAAVSELIGDGTGGEAHRRMRARAAAMAHPGAALRAAQACLELGDRYRAASQASR